MSVRWKWAAALGRGECRRDLRKLDEVVASRRSTLLSRTRGGGLGGAEDSVTLVVPGRGDWEHTLGILADLQDSLEQPIYGPLHVDHRNRSVLRRPPPPAGGLTRHPSRWLSPQRPSSRGFGRGVLFIERRVLARRSRRGVESTAVVYPVSVGRRQAPGHHGSRTPRATRGVGVGRRGCLSAWCGVGRFEAPCPSFKHAAVAVVGCSRGEGDVPGPDGPDDPSQIVGHRERRHVVAAPLADLQRPLVQARQRLGGPPPTSGGHQHGACTMGQQVPLVAVTPLADAIAADRLGPQGRTGSLSRRGRRGMRLRMRTRWRGWAPRRGAASATSWRRTWTSTLTGTAGRTGTTRTGTAAPAGRPSARRVSRSRRPSRATGGSSPGCSCGTRTRRVCSATRVRRASSGASGWCRSTCEG